MRGEGEILLLFFRPIVESTVENHFLCPLQNVLPLQFCQRAEHGQHEAALWGGGVDVLFQTDKLHALSAYNANGFDIALVQRLLQHSSAATTQRYIGIEPQRIEQAIQNHAQLI